MPRDLMEWFPRSNWTLANRCCCSDRPAGARGARRLLDPHRTTGGRAIHWPAISAIGLVGGRVHALRSSGSGRVSGAICQSANVTIPLTAANRRRKASLSPALALSRRRLPISALVVRDFSSGLKDSHVSSNTFCKSCSVSGFKAFIVQTLTKLPSGWGRARRLRTPQIKERGTPPPDFTLFPRVNVAIKHAN